MNAVKVGLIGFGTIGTGVARLLMENAPVIEERLGFPLPLAAVADTDTATDRGVSLPPGMLTGDARPIIEDPEIPLVVELIGGLEPARTFVLDALARGKYVVTANKALLAHHWEEIVGAAHEAGTDIGYEASVGGGIPIIRSLREGLAGNRIRSIHGIINGTSNYILSRMTEEGSGFAATLREAQSRGYAEAEPGLDIEGTDAAHKLAILASLAFRSRVRLERIYTEGIAGISPLDIDIARELGYTMKLLAVAKERGGSVEARVHPTMLPSRHLLATVGGAFNAVYVRGDAVGPTLYYGLGAGSLPTASAVVGDLMEMARRVVSGGGYPHPRGVGLEEVRPVLPMDDVVCPYYIRFMSPDRPGVLAAISGVLARHEISIASVIQKGREAGGPVPIVMMTHEAREAGVQAALGEIGSLPVVSEPPTLIRVERGDGFDEETSPGTEEGKEER